MKGCWNFVPEDRPTFCQLVKQLGQQHPEFQYAMPIELPKNSIFIA